MSAVSPDKTSKRHKKNRGTLPDANSPEGEKKPRKPKKDKVDVDLDASPSSSETGQPAKSKLHKHNKEESFRSADEGKETKKKRKHAEIMAEEGVVDDDDNGKKDRKHKKKRTKDPKTAQGLEDRHHDKTQKETSPVPKDKKDKKKRREAVDGEEEEDKAALRKKSKKRRKNPSSSEFPDPTVDESLIEQARRALLYAFTQFADPDSWKFHKARQNWLIRNIWSEEAIPDIYIPLATRYLEGIQGGAREILVNTCREILQTPQAGIDENASAGEEVLSIQPSNNSKLADMPLEACTQADNASTDAANDIKRRRAASLIAALT